MVGGRHEIRSNRCALSSSNSGCESSLCSRRYNSLVFFVLNCAAVAFTFLSVALSLEGGEEEADEEAATMKGDEGEGAEDEERE